MAICTFFRGGEGVIENQGKRIECNCQTKRFLRGIGINKGTLNRGYGFAKSIIQYFWRASDAYVTVNSNHIRLRIVDCAIDHIRCVSGKRNRYYSRCPNLWDCCKWL